MPQSQSNQFTYSSPLSPPNDRTCPLCHVAMSARFTGIVAEFTGELFDIKECPVCGLGLTHSMPADMDAYYQANYYGNRHGFTNWIRVRRRLHLVRSRVGARTGRNLLDFGCGDGSFLLAACAEGWGLLGRRAESAHVPP